MVELVSGAGFPSKGLGWGGGEKRAVIIGERVS